MGGVLILQANSVDPRDVTWEIIDPQFRVHFWHQEDSSNPQSSWVSDEWELSGADVTDVLGWAEKHAVGRSFSVYVVLSRGDGLGSIRIAGIDPTAS